MCMWEWLRRCCMVRIEERRSAEMRMWLLLQIDWARSIRPQNQAKVWQRLWLWPQQILKVIFIPVIYFSAFWMKNTPNIVQNVHSLMNHLQDPFLMKMRTRGKGTKADPNIVDSFDSYRFVGCCCQDGDTNVKWFLLFDGQPKRCQCGYWFQLKTQQGPEFGKLPL